MKKTIGILAHVDAGKTTLSEQLLYITGKVKNPGNVNNGTSNLDTNEIEKERGITIFADQAEFEYKGDTYYLIDTPGHIDFSPEVERSLMALDYGILVINGGEGVQSHTSTLFRLLESYNIPFFIFINKADMPAFNIERILDDIKIKLTENIVLIESIDDLGETAAENDIDFLDKFISGNFEIEDIEKSMSNLISKKVIYPVCYGTALKSESIKKFFDIFHRLTFTYFNENTDFKGIVYKVRNRDTRLTFIKCLEGCLRVKDELCFNEKEKINEIRFYNGEKFENRKIAYEGDIFAVTGLKTPVCGDIIEKNNNNIVNKKSILKSALEAGVIIKDGTDINTVMKYFKIVESEEPSLSMHFNSETEEIVIYVMGKIQLEVLEQEIKNRFNIEIGFKNPKVQYRETILKPVIGYGHYEPMRHYAEVKFRLEPNERGKGITYESRCDKERLPLHWHKLIEKHIFEKTHRGILTGSPITDINIVLIDGKDHLKHTEPGDFREATYRAVRQGLEKADNILLEPYYSFEIYTSSDYIGRIMSDIQKKRGRFEPPVQKGNVVFIKGRGPVEEFMDYSGEILSLTKGTGNINMFLDGYEYCDENIQERVIKDIGYNKGADKDNPSSSVFAAKGTSFVAEWYECEQYMKTYSEE
ncbi:MAG: TetM/TetW/TetO/TetS family tetracycline resistance ribosomal protection protein [Clostridia bacterium]|nr:TetM/TetW/TetO/TetS family tetracycline resistance ribosomal protection protein [Clostridia bacterium]